MNLYAKRREIIAKDMYNNSLMLIFSGNAVLRSEDQEYPFCVDRNFYYLTGLEKENIVLAISKVNEVTSETLFVLPFDETLAKWVGGRYTVEEASEISDVGDVRYIEDLDTYVGKFYNQTRMFNNRVYFDMWHYTMDQRETASSKYLKKIRDNYPGLRLVDAYPILTSMRLVKDDYEVECTKQAIAITKSGVEQMMKSIKPDLNEAAMAGLFSFVLAQNKVFELAFDTIACAGKRATILHYHDNNQDMKDGELFLCDLGSTFKHYCADVSRTFPVNGKFTDRQKELYQVVLNAQKIVEHNAKPGTTTKALNQLVIDYYKVELPKHGLNKPVSEYYFHGVSHQIGLDVHDVGSGSGLELRAGNIISNEPGLYIEDENIGIRIEDDLLITGTGCTNLTADIIKEINDIEVFMNK